MEQVIRAGALAVQVCAPAALSDAEVEDFVNRTHPSGTSGGWAVCREGATALDGDPQRVTCAERSDHVHIVLDC